MACGSCGTGEDGSPKGCKNNGTCGTDGCNKLTVFDWLSNMSLPDGQEAFNYVEVRFKNGRKDYYKNEEKITLSIGDIVATQAESGHDIGMVTLTGELVRVQMKRKKVRQDTPETLKIYRKASQRDIDIWTTAREKEESMKVRARQIAIRLDLQMKISDIEFQGDGSKATFYYTAEDRVDFRQLIKEFAQDFRTRIEMRQIGLRQEAARLGGIGSCGRELCCSTWLTDFRSVTTSAARYQQLSLNPQKLAGQCGKLKCCLNYELDAYMDALKSFPKSETKLYTQKGTAVCQKIDIFQGHLWYAYEGEWMNWHKLTTDHANEIIAANKKKEPVASLEEFAAELIEETVIDFGNVVGQDSLTRFDKPKTTNKRRNSRKRKPAGKGNKPQGDRPKAKDRTPRKPNQDGAKGPRPAAKKGPKPQAKGPRPEGKGPKPQAKGPRPEGKGPRPKSRGPKPQAQGNKPKDATSQKPTQEGQKAGGSKPANKNKRRPQKPKPNA
ncbi:regulatory iron-sulfur-containing complex subunit RicT [Dokdonia sp. Asnod1-B02]|uniref:regulatory iron-sulfur-containing complex subunit RicT n=1 Tax=Dokdonia sp. Asnod1-B02 TaxID=3160573 RepID=UPI00386973EC